MGYLYRKFSIPEASRVVWGAPIDGTARERAECSQYRGKSIALIEVSIKRGGLQIGHDRTLKGVPLSGHSTACPRRSSGNDIGDARHNALLGVLYKGERKPAIGEGVRYLVASVPLNDNEPDDRHACSLRFADIPQLFVATVLFFPRCIPQRNRASVREEIPLW